MNENERIDQLERDVELILVGIIDGSIMKNEEQERYISLIATLVKLCKDKEIQIDIDQKERSQEILDYAVDSTCDAFWYSLNNGSWTSMPSNKTITGLSAATTYSIKLSFCLFSSFYHMWLFRRDLALYRTKYADENQITPSASN